jgi:chondroitin AC lyase
MPSILTCRFFLSAVLIFSQTLAMAQRETVEMEVLRNRLINDALYDKGFVSRVEQYNTPDFTKAWTYFKMMKDNGSWKDVDYGDRDNEWAPLMALDRILVMAHAYSLPEGHHYKDKDLLRGIIKGLEYWYDVNPECNNWYKNRIAKQMYFGVIALLLQDEIGDQLVQKMINDHPESPSMTGSNRTLLAISVFYRGILEKNPGRISEGVQGVVDQVKISENEGIQPDYSFHQHGPYLYNGSYGSNFLRETIWMAAMVQGTGFSFSDSRLKILRDYYFEGTRQMVRNGLLDYNVRGRQVGRPSGFNQRADILVPQLDYFIAADKPFKENYSASKIRILERKPQKVMGNKHFWRSDYTVHHRPTYFISLKMCSERTVGVETDVNSENLLGYFLPYGLTYIYRRGDEYEDIFPVWNWARLPGVTSPDDIPVIKGKFTQEVAFVGGVCDGNYGLSAMEMEVRETTGKKSWFWFDKELVALGAGITSDNDSTVYTGINQSHLRGQVIVNGENFYQEKPVNIRDSSWIWHDSVAYFFPTPAKDLKLEAGEKTGQLHSIYGLGVNSQYRKDLFSAWFDHGIKPKNASYAYVVMPGISSGEAQEYYNELNVDILSNSAKLQVVTHKSLNMTGLVFYEAGSFKLPDGLYLKVSDPCLVLVNHNSGTLCVSDPTALLKDLKITIQNNNKRDREELTIPLPQGLEAGKSKILTEVLP